MNTRRIGFVLIIAFLLLTLGGSKYASAASWTLNYDSPAGSIKTLEVFNGKLYAGGFTGQSNGKLFVYDGTTWTDLNFSPGVGESLNMVESLQVYDNKLYIGTRVGVGSAYYSRVYYFDGIVFTQDFSTAGTSGCSGIEEMAIHNNILYAANGACGKGEVFQRNDNNNWSSLGGKITTSGDAARALTSYKSNLYVGTGTGGNQAKVWRWNGSTWNLSANITTLFGVNQDGIQSLAANQDFLYAGTAGQAVSSIIPAYDSVTWTNSLNVSGNNRLSVINDKIWAGTGDGKYYWNNGSWQAYGTGAQVVDFTEYKGYIYAAGSNGNIYRTESPYGYSISGKVTDSSSNGIAGVSLSDGAGHTATTDTSGNYTLNGQAAGTYTLTPTKEGLFFTPPSREIVLSGSMEVNFIGYPCVAPSGLNVCNLRPGDILVSRSPDYAAIFSIGGTYFTHAAMYLGEVAAPSGGAETIMPRLAEAQGYSDLVQDQVWETALTSRSFWSGTNLLDWAVIRPNITDFVKNEAIQYIRDKASAEGVTFDISASKWTTDKFYCSKLVWYSYLASGIDLEVDMGVGSNLLDWWVTPDDLFFSIVKGSTIVESKLGISLGQILLTLWSPAHILLVDPSGLRTGFDPDSGTILNEIPLATYTAPPSAEVETIAGIGVGDGWKVVVTGYASGEYVLEYRYIKPGTLTIIETGTTASGQVKEYPIEDPISFETYLPLIIR